MQTEKEICKRLALVYADRDWHKLTTQEELLVRLLEIGGYTLPNKPANGFVGRANPDKQ